jgi:hypothetical protein
MALDKIEISKFNKGIVSSASEDDLDGDIATFSLNIDSEREMYALRGIKGDYILGEEGWEIPRYAKWEIKVATNVPGDLNKKIFIVHSYDKSFALILSTNAGALADGDWNANDRTWVSNNGINPVKVDLSAATNKGTIADAIKTTLDSCTVDGHLANITNNSTYFTTLRGGTLRSEADGGTLGTNGVVIVKSNFLGDINIPYAPQASLDADARITYDANTGVSNIYFPDSERYRTYATKFIKGTGLSQNTQGGLHSELGSFNFSFLKSINQKGISKLFGLTSQGKAFLFDNVSDDTTGSLHNLGTVSVSGQNNEISAEQRNINLYIGTGGGVVNQGLWLGEIDRTQLNKTFSREPRLEVNNLKTLSREQGPMKFDNIVVPTLHFGLNSSNGGIAGAASIYAESSISGDDVTDGDTDSDYNGKYIRSVNSWAVQCLKNVGGGGTTYDDYNDFKLGMIFRLDLYGPHVAGSSPGTIDDNPTGTSAYEYLRDVKQFAKGDFSQTDQERDNATGNNGGDGEELHSGDLFQLVYVPSAGGIDLNAVQNSDVNMFRFAYVGVLTGNYIDDTTDDSYDTNTTANNHNSEKAFFGLPAYTFAHYNDDSDLYRIRTTGKSATNLTNSTNTTFDSSSSEITFDNNHVDWIDLEEELDIPDFEIGTIAECKSCNGTGGFGGETGSDINYFTGYGKLWVSNRNEHDKIYLIDISNWDRINVNEPRISYKAVTLDFSRIHETLFNTDETTYGNGLIRLWYGAYGDSDLQNLVGDYQFEREPIGQYISSICETYSHKPHLGDAAAAGVGTGKWRVWVQYNKASDLPHDRWDQFLYNFRPQGWGDANAKDRQDNLGANDVYSVLMFDKTPPYQECAWIKMDKQKNDEDYKKIYYPYDKFGFTNNELSSGRKTSIRSGTTFGKGDHQLGRLSGPDRRDHFGTFGGSVNTLNFRNPSGEWHAWHHVTDGEFNAYRVDWSNSSESGELSPTYFFFMGTNIGWNQEKPRQINPFRHCLKPYYKNWYFTGVTGKTSATEMSVPVAHIVSFFGDLSGEFIKDGGTIKCHVSKQPGVPGTNDGSWWGYANGKTKDYDGTKTMFTMHDSPVAFSTLSGSANEETAAFSSGEDQGAPATTAGSYDQTDGTYDDGDTSTRGLGDTEAGYRINNSVPATLGYSRYNQYRYHHDHSGTKELNKDSGHTNDDTDRPGYCKEGGDTGGAYYGQDGFGHYNMITTTWACNQDILNNTNTHQTFGQDENDSKGRWRVFGNHLREKYNKLERLDDDTIKGHAHDSITNDFARLKAGTGYCTYLWNDANDTYSPDGDAGYYENSTQITAIGNETATDNLGTDWENRKTVHCWSTTALTDSIFNDVTFDNSGKTEHGAWSIYKSPRCSFREIEMPAGFDFSSITAVDMVSWQKPTISGNGEIITGYMIQGPLSSSPFSNQDETTTGFMVLNPKVNDKNVKERIGQKNSGDEESAFLRCQTKAAIEPITASIKQSKIKSEEDIDWSYQIAAYKNNHIIAKNLIPGISDKLTLDDTHETDRKRTWFGKSESDNYTFNRMWDSYSPIIVGNIGNNDQECISTWIRPQFKTGEIGIQDLNYGSTYPYYVCDLFYNFWAEDERAGDIEEDGTTINTESINWSGFDRSKKLSTDSQDDSTDSDLQPTEGWGSSAGSTDWANNSVDNKYPSTYSANSNIDEYEEGSNITEGAHIKVIKKSIFEKIEEIAIDAADTGSGEFQEGTVEYKFSYLYDGFQESTLNDTPFRVTITEESKYIKLKLKLPRVEVLGISPRVTHINIYRRNNPEDLYRLVKSISLDNQEDKAEVIDDEYHYIIKDEGVTATYEAINGIAESLTDLTPNYKLSCQLNDFLFVSGIGHRRIKSEGEHLLLRSKQGKFSVFDWSNDFLDLPTKPVGMVAFAGKIWIFDESNIYKINPEGLYIEDRTEGIGLMNNKSVVVTDIGMFFCDRNNIWVHNGREANPIGGPILYNQSKPEWQVGYIDAVKRASATDLGYMPVLTYDASTQNIYVVLQGYNESFSSYSQHKTRIYCFNIEQKRWDYLDSPNVKSLTSALSGDMVMSDGYQIYNYRRDKRNRKNFQWESKTFKMGSTNYDKSFKKLKLSGELCFYKFNNTGFSYASTGGEDSDQDDFGGNVMDEETIDWVIGDNTHILEDADASEDDDIKVYVDNVLQTMRLENRKPNIGHYIANDPTGSIYKINTKLPAFDSKNNELVGYDGNRIKDSFSLDLTSLPEFIQWPNGQFKKRTLQGGIEELVHLHKGMYLYFSGKDEIGNKYEEIVKIRDILIFFHNSGTGINEVITDTTDSDYNANAVTIRTWRGQLGTKAVDWYQDGRITTHNPIRMVTPNLKYPKGTKGRDTKVVFQNQKSYVDSFAITYRPRRFK